MFQTTPFLPGIAPGLFGRQRRSQLDQLRARTEQLRRAALSQLCEIFGSWLPPALLAQDPEGVNSRKRTYPMSLTFWAFLSQVLNPGSACREVVRKVQVWSVQQHQKLPDSGTSAYCQARGRLPLNRLQELHQHLATKLITQTAAADLWLGHRVKVVDGTGLSMPDTAANQKAWPQPVSQKSGCGFPVTKIVGCFCLASGALLEWVQGTLKDHDCRLFQRLLATFHQGEMVLADRGFCSYGNLAALLQQGVNAVMRIHHFRKVDWRTGRRLGRRDQLVQWRKPLLQTDVWTKGQWEQLPEQIALRLVEIRVEVPGFRTQRIVLVTTLIEAEKYTAAGLGRLYFRRWAVELFFRDIKITLGMDILRCQTPAMVEKEMVMHALAYNLIRALMQDIAHSYQIELSRLSFKGTVDALRQWRELFEGGKTHPRLTGKRRLLFYFTVATDPLIARPKRSEPRAVKRRPKNFRLLTKPRKEMVVERCRKWSQKPSKHALN
jgi:Transposase DDE domain/Insertion element 4 transposase N-terminal